MRMAIRGTAWGLCLCLLASTVAAQQQRNKQPREDQRREGKLKVGDTAPDFTLATSDGKRKVTLSSFRGQRPVALIFGSYT